MRSLDVSARDMKSWEAIEQLLAGAANAYENADTTQNKTMAMLVVAICCWVLNVEDETPEYACEFKELDLIRDAGQAVYLEAKRKLSENN